MKDFHISEETAVFTQGTKMIYVGINSYRMENWGCTRAIH
jgi:hypothetical protein